LFFISSDSFGLKEQNVDASDIFPIKLKFNFFRLNINVLSIEVLFRGSFSAFKPF
jgi:hypothetical protein